MACTRVVGQRTAAESELVQVQKQMRDARCCDTSIMKPRSWRDYFKAFVILKAQRLVLNAELLPQRLFDGFLAGRGRDTSVPRFAFVLFDAMAIV